MDTSETTHLSLCAGYGGIDLGLRRVFPNLRTIAYAEIEAFAVESLLARMEGGQLDAAPIWSNLKSFPWEQFSGMVDILSGGYPCQPFSSAGKRLGTEDERHLWPYIASGIRILKPRVCFFENVEGHISLGLSTVISDLEELGYKVSWGIFSAAEVGAPHQRKRVFILAHRNDTRLEGLRECSASQGWEAQTGHAGGRCDVWPSRPGKPQHAWEPPRVVADTKGSVSGIKAKRQWRKSAGGRSEEVVGDPESGARLGRAPGDEGHAAQPDEAGSEQQTKPPLGGDAARTASGLDYAELCVTCNNRTDELRLLGNGVVPATAAKAFKTLIHDLEAYIPRECGLLAISDLAH